MPIRDFKGSSTQSAAKNQASKAMQKWMEKNTYDAYKILGGEGPAPRPGSLVGPKDGSLWLKASQYASAAYASLSDPLYQQTAQRLGISNYNSVNDYAQVLGNLSIGGAAGNNPAPPPPPDPIQQAQAAADAARNRQPASYPQQAAPAVDPMAGYQEALNAQAAQYQQQMSAQAAQAQQQMSALQQLMVQQQTQYQSQIADAQRQQQLMASQAAESQRQAEALQRAFVPNLEPTAAAPAIGDSRTQGDTGSRTAAANTLSNLTILTGLGGSSSGGASMASPLAGLQIA